MAWSSRCYHVTISGAPLRWQHIMQTLRNISLSFITPTCLWKTPWALSLSARSFPIQLFEGLLHILSSDYIINILTCSISDICVGTRLDYSVIRHQKGNNFILGWVCFYTLSRAWRTAYLADVRIMQALRIHSVSDCELITRAPCKSFTREAGRARSCLMVDHH